jgi:hypothetical protein
MRLTKWKNVSHNVQDYITVAVVSSVSSAPPLEWFHFKLEMNKGSESKVSRYPLFCTLPPSRSYEYR